MHVSIPSHPLLFGLVGTTKYKLSADNDYLFPFFPSPREDGAKDQETKVDY